MFKEMIISIIIIVTIFSLDMFTQEYTNKTTQEITKLFLELKEIALKEDKKEIKDKIRELDENWNNRHDKLSYYIEHDEIEKVDTAIVSAKSYIETEDYSAAIAELEVGKFVMDHIQEKYAFNLENLF